MRHRSFIFVAAVVAALLVGSIAAYAYDSSRDDLIAKGITVGGVDVGGKRAGVARRLVRQHLAVQLERPVAVTLGHRHFVLSPARAHLQADVGGMVDEALSQSRSGNIFTRVGRDLTGGEKKADVSAKVNYSQGAVDRLVRRVQRGLDRKAQDASLNFPSLTQVKERNGIKVRSAELRQRVVAALTAPAGARSVRAPVEVTRPKVTRSQLSRKYPTVLVLRRSAFTLTLYKHLDLKKSYTVAVGQVGLETPAGLYHIQNKGVNVPWNVPNSAWAGSLAGQTIPGGAPNNPIKARWLGIFAGAGIHGTDSLGSLGTAASHGCVRMSIPDVIELYPQVPVGTPIFIA